MLALDVANGAGARPHDQRVRRCRAAAVADTLEQLAVGDPGRDEEDVVAADQLVGGEYAVEVVAGVDRPLALRVVLGPQPALDVATHALHGGGGDDAFGGAADAEQKVDTGA